MVIQANTDVPHWWMCNYPRDLAGAYISLYLPGLSVCWILFLFKETDGMPAGVRGQNPKPNS